MAPQNRTLLLLCWLPMAIQAQVDTCGCEKELNTICHLSVKDFCYNVDGCQHTLDGGYGRLSCPQIKNPKNFGSMGISECGINIQTQATIFAGLAKPMMGLWYFFWEACCWYPQLQGSIWQNVCSPTYVEASAPGRWPVTGIWWWWRDEGKSPGDMWCKIKKMSTQYGYFWPIQVFYLQRHLRQLAGV